MSHNHSAAGRHPRSACDSRLGARGNARVGGPCADAYWRQGLEAAAGRPAWPEWSAAWPPLPSPPQRRHQLPHDLRGGYAYAARNQEILQYIPCYCGCVREGHRSNLSCFISGFRQDSAPIWTDHSFSCPMCVHIAREVMLMTSQGMPLQRVREEIDKRYRSVGEGTHTPPPAHQESGQ